MMYECCAWYCNTPNGIALDDEECSTPKHPISDEDAKTYMSMLEAMGCKRHETRTQIFYDSRIDARHGFEHIFWKEDKQ